MADKDIERLKERIKFETEVLKLAILVAVAMGGSAVSLLLREFTPLRLGLAGLGLIGTLGLLMTVWRFYQRIDRRIDQIKEVP